MVGKLKVSLLDRLRIRTCMFLSWIEWKICPEPYKSFFHAAWISGLSSMMDGSDEGKQSQEYNQEGHHLADPDKPLRIRQD